jgi:hypothetical protein
MEKGEMSIDQRRGVINLIPKKDKDVRYLKNWRPISLLNTDYKILTKTLAVRLKMVLPSVIHPDQVAYLKGRYIGQNIRTIIDIMDYTNDKNLTGIIAFLDFEKAFDSIDWRVIDEALEKFNIGKGFRSWVKCVYTNISSCVTNCGFSSKDFIISRGVRQGCPLSAYLFIVVAEILAIKIRSNNSIEGINIGNSEIKVVQMADDTTSFLKDENSLKEVLSTLEKFKILSGLKLNISKSEAMWIGKDKDSKEKPLGLKWVKGVKALGIYFTYNEKEMEEKNFTEKLNELKRLLALWGQRDLSVIGRITVLKSLAFSKVIYQCNNLAVSKEFLKQLNRVAFQFIWNYKPEKVKRTVVIADYDKGGLKMLDVECFVDAQKVMWVKRLLKKDEGSWKIYPSYLLTRILGNHSFQCSLDMSKLRKWMPIFYLQVFEAWEKSKVDPEGDPFKIRREILWQNKYINIKKKEMFYEDWYKNGIVLYHDIIDEKGEFKSEEKLQAEFKVKIKVMDYNSLKLAIPRSWKEQVKGMKIPPNAISSDELPFFSCGKQPFAISILQNRNVYWEYVSRKETTPASAQKWCREYNIDIEHWKLIYKFYATIKDTKLKAFQYKILFNLIPCNLYLKRIGKSTTDRCDKCKELEDVNHYFVGCPGNLLLWEQLSIWWKNMTGQNVKISEEDVMIGLSSRARKVDKEEQLNMIILAVKWKIHCNKQDGSETVLYQALFAVKQMIETLEFIACKTMKRDKHDKIWDEIKSYIT